MTNFATYFDSTNAKAPIAQRGKAKQKRVDLRLVALALVVTRDGAIPLLSHTYPGDRPDVTWFAAVIDDLVTRYEELGASLESLTVVYDAGQSSIANHHGCPAPSAERVLAIFADLTRRELYRDGQLLQTHPDLSALQRQVLDLLDVPATAYQP